MFFCFANAQEAPRFTISGNNVDILNTNTNYEIKLSRYKADIHVLGDIADVSITMEFFNTSNDIKEGTVTFPLPEGVSISGYAIDINGVMREAVPVEKVKATAVFESIERRRVDPGLIEKVEGNNFRTRIYPINPNNSRTIEVRYKYSMRKNSSNYVLNFMLPKTPIDVFELNVEVLSSESKPQIIEQPSGDFQFINNDYMWAASLLKKNFSPTQSLNLLIPAHSLSGFSVLKQNDDKSYFFYGSYPILQLEKSLLEKPKHLGIIIDNSLSNIGMDKSRIKSFLNDYIKSNPNITIQATCVNVYSQPPKTFVIKNGYNKELLEWIDNIVFDGGTDLGRIPSLAVDAAFLFSDGISTIGDYSNKATYPIYTVNTLPISDHSLLKFISQSSKGFYYDLNENTNEAIIQDINYSKTIVTSVNAESGIDIYPHKNEIITDQIIITGIISNINDPIHIQYANGQNIGRLTVYPTNSPIVNDWRIDQIWAQKKIAELEVFYNKNEIEILELGKKYGIVTRNTSLIVLESIDDYIKYKILPPAELMEEYFKAINDKIEEKDEEKNQLLSAAIDMTDELSSWWNGEKKLISIIDTASDTLIPPSHMMLPDVVMDSIIIGQPGSANNVQVRGVNSISENNTPVYIVDGEVYDGDISSIDPQTINSVEILQETTATEMFGSRGSSGVTIITTNGNNDVKLHEFTGSASILKSTEIEENSVVNDQPNDVLVFGFKKSTEYMSQLESIDDEKLSYDHYLNLRENNLTSPTFYFDVANYFFAKGYDKLGVQIISNLLELKMEDPVILKTIYYTLIKYKQYDKAVYVAERLMKFRSMDPQTYRDLALGYIELKEYQKALDFLYDALLKEYTDEILDRDEGIEEILIMEINHLIALHKNQLDISRIHPDIIHDMPVDLRIVMNWNTDLTDFDLYVTDPENEECSYSHVNTSSGGRLSDDFTDGFGPEQFIIKDASKGTYIIEADFYGNNAIHEHVPTTLLIEVYKYYGTKKETKEIILYQISSQDREKNKKVKVAEVKF